ncbi:MAG: holdfast anchoring protein HfaA [Brevundimonas sp.]|uniref:holdfast anchoring protein HfaA n=1 Tax=Brevundimonas sp. TaxID=1871086 RepID=UPI002734A59A|nr:holdfast anchoring protein HfaA [Brevundimonas sp.]MDP3404307.1 holdfast anchoring protein HfaA [Brevundimonas sp.]
MKRSLFAATILAGLAPASLALAQSVSGSGLGAMESGYGGAGRVAHQAYNPSTRDANGNRLIVNGRIIDPRGQAFSSYSSSDAGTGAAYAQSGAGGGTTTSTAIGNLLTVQVTGSNNVVVLNARQTNNGTIIARANAQ